MTKEITIPNQRLLWEKQHAIRGLNGHEAGALCYEPNDAAVILASVLNPGSRILEYGSANGRDARWWASLGLYVDCVDFSEEALRQLMCLAQEQNVDQQLFLHWHDIANGTLPPNLSPTKKFHAFYARSALHMADQPLYRLMDQVTKRILRNGLIVIEGKGQNDRKIARSQGIGNGLVCDLDGHLRRVWTEESMEQLAVTNGWRILGLDEQHEQASYGCNSMLRLIAQV